MVYTVYCHSILPQYTATVYCHDRDFIRSNCVTLGNLYFFQIYFLHIYIFMYIGVKLDSIFSSETYFRTAVQKNVFVTKNKNHVLLVWVLFHLFFNISQNALYLLQFFWQNKKKSRSCTKMSDKTGIFVQNRSQIRKKKCWFFF